MKKFWLTLSIAAGILSSCANKPQQEATLSGLKAENFQTEVKGKKTDLYTLKNKAGMEVCITNFGGRIVSIMVPDKNGKMQDVVLGFDSISNYINIPSDFGASVGRYANRINKGKFVLDKDTIQLPTNNFGHCLHGGPEGWQYQVYDAKVISDSCVELTRISPDGDANFPGKVTAKVTFTLTKDNAIDISYEATTDKKTIINMTNHSYFNLSGDPNNTITDNQLYVNADKFTPVDSTYMVSSYEEMGDKLIKGICGQVDGSVIPGYVGLEAGQSAFGDVYAWFKRVLEFPIKKIIGNSTLIDEATKAKLVDEACL